MANIIDYCKWRGDLTLKERPFNDVDNLLQSVLAYAELERIMTSEEKITLTEACARFLAKAEDTTDLQKESNSVLYAMAGTKRFRDMKISGLETRTDDQVQFAAMCCELSDGTTYLAFRGTDDTLIGWKEDFEISYRHIPSQELAVDYMERHMKGIFRRYRIGGHSKGGHLAMYASMLLPEKLQKKILVIYSNDGPGMSAEMVQKDGFDRIRDRIVRIEPEFSVIGRILRPDIPAKTVKSDRTGIMQHSAISWQVEGEDFELCTQENPDCRAYNEIVDRWLSTTSGEERQALNDEFFKVLESTGCKTVKEFSERGFKNFGTLFFGYFDADKTAKVTFGRFVEAARVQFMSRLKGN